MRERPIFLSDEDLRAIRRWRWMLIGAYGCLLGGLIAYIAFDQHREADYAAADRAVVASTHGNLVPPE